MPNTKSAKKRLRQNTVRRMRNRAARSALRTHVKRVLSAIESKDVAKSQAELSVAVVKLDKAAAKGIIHANKAARIKSRLQRRLKAMKQVAS